MKGQFWRGGVHSIGLWFWFAALPKISLADMTAIGFSGPIFIMIGASLFLGEQDASSINTKYIALFLKLIILVLKGFVI